jgi:tRNA pseudouridine55 synthase
MPKQYRATFLLGRTSDTDDIEVEIREITDAPVPSRLSIEGILPRFLGAIEQVPPAHSAVKIAGRRAYKLARAGKTINLAPRTVTIHRLLLRRYAYPELELDIECGSGTYVRALGRDLAAALGTGAVMAALERTSIGAFRIFEALHLADATLETVTRHLQSPISAVPNLPHVRVSVREESELHHGRSIAAVAETESSWFEKEVATSEFAAVNDAGQLVAILRQKEPGEFWPLINFC